MYVSREIVRAGRKLDKSMLPGSEHSSAFNMPPERFDAGLNPPAALDELPIDEIRSAGIDSIAHRHLHVRSRAPRMVS